MATCVTVYKSVDTSVNSDPLSKDQEKNLDVLYVRNFLEYKIRKIFENNSDSFAYVKELKFTGATSLSLTIYKDTDKLKKDLEECYPDIGESPNLKKMIEMVKNYHGKIKLFEYLSKNRLGKTPLTNQQKLEMKDITITINGGDFAFLGGAVIPSKLALFEETQPAVIIWLNFYKDSNDCCII
jgi:hypothetical protein